MSTLTICRQTETKTVNFAPPAALADLLEQAGVLVLHPCGSRGSCGKCRVELSGFVSAPNEAEQKAGFRLACQAQVLGDATVTLPEQKNMEQIQADAAILPPGTPKDVRWGAAVDIGTTTIALLVYDLSTGVCMGQAAARNPQASVAADVMGRIGAAMDGKLEYLQRQVLDAVSQLLEQAAGSQAAKVDMMVVTGNTTMLYLLTGRDPACLSRAPFAADTLFDTEMTILGRRAYLPACISAFVGADITCAVLASGMCSRPETALLCDVGTNGEIALWKDGVLHVTSTAAGPAFEGAGISCGCGSVAGAIDRVRLKNGRLQVHTIGEAPATGLCGSGLIDTVAALRKLAVLDETGALENGAAQLTDGVSLLQKDIRAVQLAKAAIAAGIATLLETAGVQKSEIDTFYIAGGFGSHLNAENAAAIGLFPTEWTKKVQVLGNAALTGAAQLLPDTQCRKRLRSVTRNARPYDLGGNPVFNEHYMAQMFLTEETSADYQEDLP